MNGTTQSIGDAGSAPINCMPPDDQYELNEQLSGGYQTSPGASPSGHQAGNLIAYSNQPLGNHFSFQATSLDHQHGYLSCPSLTNEVDSAYATGSTYAGAFQESGPTFSQSCGGLSGFTTDPVSVPTYNDYESGASSVLNHFSEVEGNTMPLRMLSSSSQHTFLPYPGKRLRSTSPTSTDNSAGSRRRVKPAPYRTAADVITIPEGKERSMYFFVEEWKGKDHLPDKQKLEAMSRLVHLPLLDFTMWFAAKVQLAPGRAIWVADSEMAEPTQLIHPDIKRLIDDYIERHNRQACKVKDGTGDFRCTWNCGYATSKRNAWEQHEETKQPQQFWVCADCQSGLDAESAGPHVNHRKDKFLEHAKIHAKAHPDDPDYRYTLRTRSEVMYNAPFHPQCTFKLPNGLICYAQFSSWKDRIEHYVRHYKSNPGTRSSARVSRRRGQRGERDNDVGGDHAHLVVEKPPMQERSTTGSPTTTVAQDQRSASSNRHCSILGLTSVNALPEMMGSFFDVVQLRVVTADLEQARFVALQYSDVASDSIVAGNACHGRQDGLTLESVPSPLREAIVLTREMQVRYLWVNVGSESGHVDQFYQKALFVIVISAIETSALITQFACTYDQLDMVQDWVQHDIAFDHVQFLGHGAYSMVDKVEVRYASHASSQHNMRTFARKSVVRASTSSPLAASAHLREIEIMQKFDHPHIAQFVAAYYQDNALNILISPVAECDLRQYLSYPDRFPDERQFLPQWFLCLADAVEYIHDLKCRHKDIKPANILISDHKVLLTDFGTSTHFSNDQSATAGDVFMTPKYCAPEVAALGERGRSADIWSLGCVYLEMLAVLVHQSVTDLHDSIAMESVSADRHHTYHSQQVALLAWLDGLCDKDYSAHIASLAGCIRSMLDSEACRRPKAAEVVRLLQESSACSSQAADKDISCPYCPAAADRRTSKTNTGPALASKEPASATVTPEDDDNEALVAALLDAVL
ncbi:putative serine/threonine-protein kinase, active [Septoria linicola]|nr:putative serine/threonine-protein kinase, active [Septoria linicola]